MRHELKIIIDQDDRFEIERLLRMQLADKAFGVIYEISCKIRQHQKHGEKAEADQVLRAIQDEIFESGLMEYYS